MEGKAEPLFLPHLTFHHKPDTHCCRVSGLRQSKELAGHIATEPFFQQESLTNH